VFFFPLFLRIGRRPFIRTSFSCLNFSHCACRLVNFSPSPTPPFRRPRPLPPSPRRHPLSPPPASFWFFKLFVPLTRVRIGLSFFFFFFQGSFGMPSLLPPTQGGKKDAGRTFACPPFSLVSLPPEGASGAAHCSLARDEDFVPPAFSGTLVPEAYSISAGNLLSAPLDECRSRFFSTCGKKFCFSPATPRFF